MTRPHNTQIMIMATLIALLLASCTVSPIAHGQATSAGSGSAASAKVNLEQGLGGWGPARPTFTDQHPASYATFNSITGSNWGDERNFFEVKGKNAPNSSYADSISAVPGKTYTGIIWYDNAASPSIAPAVDTTLRVQAPSTIVGAGELSALISAENAKPETVWYSAVITLPNATTAVALRYVPGSAVVHSAGKVNGQIMPNSLYTSGAKLGCDTLDGEVDGSGKCGGYVTFDFVLDQPNFTVTVLASSTKTPDLSPSIDTTVGDTVAIRVEYKNTGSTQQDDVELRASGLPQGIQITKTLILFSNSATKSRYVSLTSLVPESIVTTGINVGSYAPGGACFVKFFVKIGDISGYDFSRYGQIYRYPQIEAITNNGMKQSGVKVLVFGPLQ